MICSQSPTRNNALFVVGSSLAGFIRTGDTSCTHRILDKLSDSREGVTASSLS
jgi:hypothetical protein